MRLIRPTWRAAGILLLAGQSGVSSRSTDGCHNDLRCRRSFGGVVLPKRAAAMRAPSGRSGRDEHGGQSRRPLLLFMGLLRAVSVSPAWRRKDVQSAGSHLAAARRCLPDGGRACSCSIGGPSQSLPTLMPVIWKENLARPNSLIFISLVQSQGAKARSEASKGESRPNRHLLTCSDPPVEGIVA